MTPMMELKLTLTYFPLPHRIVDEDINGVDILSNCYQKALTESKELRSRVHKDKPR
jgi:hypothetical protein